MVEFIKSDLEFILQQIMIAEQHADGADLLSLLPNSLVPFGLRTIDGSFNNLVRGPERIRLRRQPVPAADGSVLPGRIGRDDL